MKVISVNIVFSLFYLNFWLSLLLYFNTWYYWCFVSFCVNCILLIYFSPALFRQLSANSSPEFWCDVTEVFAVLIFWKCSEYNLFLLHFRFEPIDIALLSPLLTHGKFSASHFLLLLQWRWVLWAPRILQIPLFRNPKGRRLLRVPQFGPQNPAMGVPKGELRRGAHLPYVGLDPVGG